ncbi:flagellar biosynthesis, cell-distal portion of basal-body rod [Klebsiella quasipneumoniae]|nr:flagellar biosynthesis, cell-distal portion of basal-body rod [Klebsiella quasipneumoniae]
MAFNPELGSSSPEVLLDNAKRLDELTNGPAATVPDRAGEPLDSWRKMQEDNAALVDETRQNLIPLSRQYMTLAAAQADIANIPEGSTTYYRSPDDNALAIEVMNVGGMLQPTGRSMVSKAYIDVRLPSSSRSRLYAGVFGADGTICIGGRKSDGKTEIADGTVLEDVIGTLRVYTDINTAMSKTAVDMCFVYVDADNNPVLYANVNNAPVPVFSIITENQITNKFQRSGYIAGAVGKNDELLYGSRKTDGAFVTYLSGNIDEKIKWLEENSGGVTHAVMADAYGDSKTAGTGGTPYPTQLAALIGNGFVPNNYGIGGQKSGQIAMRMGAIPTYITVDGNAIPAANSTVTITQFNGASATAAPTYPSQDRRILSTNSDNTTRTLDGWICGVKCRITRTASGSNNNTKTEVYTLTALEGTGVRCLPGSLFVPDYAMQDYSDREMWICAGINDFRAGASTSADYDDDVAAIKANVDALIAFAEKSGRNILLFGLTADNYYPVEFYSGIRYQRISEINYYWSQKYPAYYVRGNNGLDLRETLVAAYDSSIAQDVTDYGNDITPSSLRSDDRHPNTAGYGIYAALGYQFRTKRGY